MKIISAVFALCLISLPAFAEYSESAFAKYDYSAWAAIGFTQGGLSLGGDFEYAADRTYGIGGLTRFYQQDDEHPTQSAPGIFMFGGYVRPHFHRRAWDLFVTLGAAIVSIEDDRNNQDATSLGPVWGVGVLYQVTETVAVGMESLSTYIWFDDDFRGQVMQDALFRARFSF